MVALDGGSGSDPRRRRGEPRSRGPAPPPIASWCTDASVAVVGSLSKLFWGGPRIGWVRAPASLAIRFARVKATQDLGSSAVSQVLAERLLRSLATAAGVHLR